MESSTLTKPSQSPCTERPSTPAELIEEWIPKFAVNAGAALDAKTQAVYRAIWLEGLADLAPDVLLAAFRQTLRECPYWPVKVADIRKHVSHAVSNATDEAAAQAWERVLEIRRTRWSPDAPGGFYGGKPQLSPRVEQACRASGIFRDFDSLEGLHTWAKKRFIESFIAWSDQDKFLLPDGEVKNLLTGFAEMKALPESRETFEEMRERGLRYAQELKKSRCGQPDIKRAIRATARELTPRPPIRSLAEQKKILQQRGLLP